MASDPCYFLNIWFDPSCLQHNILCFMLAFSLLYFQRLILFCCTEHHTRFIHSKAWCNIWGRDQIHWNFDFYYQFYEIGYEIKIKASNQFLILSSIIDKDYNNRSRVNHIYLSLYKFALICSQTVYYYLLKLNLMVK